MLIFYMIIIFIFTLDACLPRVAYLSAILAAFLVTLGAGGSADFAAALVVLVGATGFALVAAAFPLAGVADLVFETEAAFLGGIDKKIGVFMIFIKLRFIFFG